MTPEMIDIGEKPKVRREATAEGFLHLSAATLAAWDTGKLPKGDPTVVAQTAGVLAAKNTPALVPLTHPIPLTNVVVSVAREREGVRARATVRATWHTGVEMEALAAVTAALLTVWDMTKALEKDARGQYPHARIDDVHVVEKRKEGSY
ncbi:MAG: cyclic pyranopterin monophosphate synthase MoaC [Thermoplasmatota archaeon]